MKTIFLAAGKSSRLSPLTEKNLLSFCGKPILIHILENAKAGGLQNFIVVCNNENIEKISNTLQKHQIKAITVIQKDINTGMAGGVLAGLEKVNDDEEIFIHNAQDYFNVSVYQKILTESQDLDGGILAKEVKEYFPGGYLEIDKQGVIKSIIEKPGTGNEPSNLVNIVAHYFKNANNLKKVLKNTSSNKDDLYEAALEKLFKTKNFKAVKYNSIWQAIKYPWHVLEMMEVLLKTNSQKVSKKAYISKSAELIGPNIIIEEGVRIFNGAILVGPCYIGKNTIIGQNALVRQSHIGAHCEIGFCSEIARSYLNNNVSTHHAYIGDSVIDNDVNFGAFSVTTNLRLDKGNIKMLVKENLINTHRNKLGCIVGQGSQIGSGAKIMPGRKISAHQKITPNTIIS